MADPAMGGQPIVSFERVFIGSPLVIRQVVEGFGPQRLGSQSGVKGGPDHIGRGGPVPP